MTYDLKYEIETFSDDELIIRVYRNDTLVGTYTNPYITTLAKMDGLFINDYLIRKIYNTRTYVIKGGR